MNFLWQVSEKDEEHSWWPITLWFYNSGAETHISVQCHQTDPDLVITFHHMQVGYHMTHPPEKHFLKYAKSMLSFPEWNVDKRSEKGKELFELKQRQRSSHIVRGKQSHIHSELR